MMTHDTAGPENPWQQAGRLAFLALYAITLLAASWLPSWNCCKSH